MINLHCDKINIYIWIRSIYNIFVHAYIYILNKQLNEWNKNNIEITKMDIASIYNDLIYCIFKI